jgi:hypothetical protein
MAEDTAARSLAAAVQTVTVTQRTMEMQCAAARAAMDLTPYSRSLGLTMPTIFKLE